MRTMSHIPAHVLPYRDPATPRLHGDLTLDPVPPGLRDPADPLPDTAVAVRPPILDDLPLSDPAPPIGLDARRSIYLTLGRSSPKNPVTCLHGCSPASTSSTSTCWSPWDASSPRPSSARSRRTSASNASFPSPRP